MQYEADNLRSFTEHSLKPSDWGQGQERGRSPAGGRFHDAIYVRSERKNLSKCCSRPLEQSAARHACHRMPQFVLEATEQHLCLKERFHFKIIFYNIRFYLLSTIYQLFYYLFIFNL